MTAQSRESDHVIPDGCRDGCEHETLRADGPPVEDRMLQSGEALNDWLDDPPFPVDHLAERFHRTYEELAVILGYRTREDSAVPWDEVPAQNRRLMCWTISHLVATGAITYGPAITRGLR